MWHTPSGRTLASWSSAQANEMSGDDLLDFFLYVSVREKQDGQERKFHNTRRENSLSDTLLVEERDRQSRERKIRERRKLPRSHSETKRSGGVLGTKITEVPTGGGKEDSCRALLRALQ